MTKRYHQRLEYAIPAFQLHPAIQAVQAVQVVKAKQRIPKQYQQKPFPSGLTFFSEFDWWAYAEIGDNKLCPTCRSNATDQYYRGSELRAKWEHLVVRDHVTIEVHEHPHCRCLLYRVVDKKLLLQLELA